MSSITIIYSSSYIYGMFLLKADKVAYISKLVPLSLAPIIIKVIVALHACIMFLYTVLHDLEAYIYICMYLLPGHLGLLPNKTGYRKPGN